MFLKTNVTAPIYLDILEHFMLPSVDQLFKDADFLFQQDLAPAHNQKPQKLVHGYTLASISMINVMRIWRVCNTL